MDERWPEASSQYRDKRELVVRKENSKTKIKFPLISILFLDRFFFGLLFSYPKNRISTVEALHSTKLGDDISRSAFTNPLTARKINILAVKKCSPH